MTTTERPLGLIDFVSRDMDIEYIGLDIFGTLLVGDACDDSEVYPYPRPGYKEFFDACKKRNINVIISSDAEPLTVAMALRDQHFPGILDYTEPNAVKRITNSGLFHYAIQCPNPNGMKDFEAWAYVYKELFGREINPKKLVVIGDTFSADILGAELFGAYSIFVPSYKTFCENDKKETHTHFYTPKHFSELVEV